LTGTEPDDGVAPPDCRTPRPPPQAGAKRRKTTAAGRRGEPDKGSPELLRKKRTATTCDDLEISPIAALYGRGLIDATQYDLLGTIVELLRRLARNLGPQPDAVTGLWLALTGAAIGRSTVTVPAAVDPAADQARRTLARTLRQLDDSRGLVVALAEGRIPPVVGLSRTLSKGV
jgi:hypothetical protein